MQQVMRLLALFVLYTFLWAGLMLVAMFITLSGVGRESLVEFVISSTTITTGPVLAFFIGRLLWKQKHAIPMSSGDLPISLLVVSYLLALAGWVVVVWGY
jgi:hypothetical protein